MGDIPRACPCCGSRHLTNRPTPADQPGNWIWQASCDQCGAKGEKALSSEAAWANWNTKTPVTP